MRIAYWPVLAVLVLVAACNGGGSNGSDAIEISLSPGSADLYAGESITVVATVVGASTDQVRWTATAGRVTADGATATYYAPFEDGVHTVTATVAGTSATLDVDVELEIDTTEDTTDPQGVAVLEDAGVEVEVTDRDTGSPIGAADIALLEFANQRILEVTSRGGDYLPAYRVLPGRTSPAGLAPAQDLLTSSTTMVARDGSGPPYWLTLALPWVYWYHRVYEAAFCDEAPLRDLAEAVEIQASGVFSTEAELVWAALPFDLGLDEAAREPGTFSTAGPAASVDPGSESGAVMESQALAETAFVLALAAYGLSEFLAAKANNRILDRYEAQYPPDQLMRYCTTPTGGVVYVTVFPTDPPPDVSAEPEFEAVILDVVPTSPAGTVFRPGEPISADVRIATNLDNVVADMTLRSDAGGDPIRGTSSTDAPVPVREGDVRASARVASVRDTEELRVGELYVALRDAETRALLDARTVAVDYIVQPAEEDLWLGVWEARVENDATGQRSTVIAEIVSVAPSGAGGPVELATTTPSGDVDVVAEGQIDIGLATPDALSGTIGCDSASGTAYGRSVDACSDLWTSEASPFTVRRTSPERAEITIDLLAEVDPTFRDLEIVKRWR
jgi:hypothetical protein